MHPACAAPAPSTEHFDGVEDNDFSPERERRLRDDVVAHEEGVLPELPRAHIDRDPRAAPVWVGRNRSCRYEEHWCALQIAADGAVRTRVHFNDVIPEEFEAPD
jgi:hypothetical protein